MLISRAALWGIAATVVAALILSIINFWRSLKMATTSEVMAEVAAAHAKLDTFKTTVQTELGEINAKIAKLEGQVTNGADLDTILAGVRGIGSRVDDLNTSVANFVTPDAEPTPEPEPEPEPEEPTEG